MPIAEINVPMSITDDSQNFKKYLPFKEEKNIFKGKFSTVYLNTGIVKIIHHKQLSSSLMADILTLL